MPELVPIPLATTFAENSDSKEQSSESLENLYVSPVSSQGKTQLTLRGTPGLRLWTTLDTSICRGMIYLAPYIYAVYGDRLYAIDRNKVTTDLGEIKRTGDVAMEKNSTHVVICTSVEAYAANYSDGVIQLQESYLNDVTYIDGYLLYTQNLTQKFWISGLDDATTINALDFTSADRLIGNVKGIIADNGEVAVLKTDSIEFYANTGNASFPFERVSAGFSEYGAVASRSIAKANGVVFFLGVNTSQDAETANVGIYAVQGYRPQKISSTELDQLIAELSDRESAKAFVYTQAGRTFYVLTFSDKTIGVDVATGAFHIRKSYGLDRWRAQNFVSAFGKEFVGDSINGKLYELDLDYFTDDGDPIVSTAVLPPVGDGMRRTCFSQLRVDIESGVGLVSGQGIDPEIVLDWSDDGGRTYSSELTTGFGSQGQYNHQVIFNRLGTSRNRTFRLTISDPVKRAITGAYVSAEAMHA